MSEMAYVALGSNLGDRNHYLATARDAIATLPGCRVVAVSSIEETTPLGGLPHPPYLNQMLAVRTTLEPPALFAELRRIEENAGRVRAARWEPRTLDLDIVLFGDRIVNTEELIIPHPGLPDRPFWQRELAELGRGVEPPGDE